MEVKTARIILYLLVALVGSLIVLLIFMMYSYDSDMEKSIANSNYRFCTTEETYTFKVGKEYYNSYILADNNTGIKYLLVKNHKGHFSITPLLNGKEGEN